MDHLWYLWVVNLGNLTCPGPHQLGVELSSAEARLCLPETAIVLDTLGTMLVTVALGMAVHKPRWSSRGAGEWESPLEREGLLQREVKAAGGGKADREVDIR